MAFNQFCRLAFEFNQPIAQGGRNGVPPIEEHIRSGQYPLVHTLAYVFRQDKLSSEAKAFIDFTRSAAGEAVIRVNGYLPSE